MNSALEIWRVHSEGLPLKTLMYSLSEEQGGPKERECNLSGSLLAMLKSSSALGRCCSAMCTKGHGRAASHGSLSDGAATSSRLPGISCLLAKRLRLLAAL